MAKKEAKEAANRKRATTLLAKKEAKEAALRGCLGQGGSDPPQQETARLSHLSICSSLSEIKN